MMNREQEPTKEDLEKLGKMSQAYWSRRAEEFSQLRMQDYDSPMREAFYCFLKAHLPWKGREEGEKPIRALDLGCGAGFFSLILHELGCQVTAVDFSEEMLERAGRNAEERGFEGIRFLPMDAQALKFVDEAFDLVITRNVTWILPDAKKAYGEMLRVLRPGGRLINLDANYGKVFNEADGKGEMPDHPTQSQEQLKMRNRIVRNLDITRAVRPEWDMVEMWGMGVSTVKCIRDVEEYLGIGKWNRHYTTAGDSRRAVMFGLIADK